MGATTRQRLIDSGNKKRLAEYDAKHAVKKPATPAPAQPAQKPVEHNQ